MGRRGGITRVDRVEPRSTRDQSTRAFLRSYNGRDASTRTASQPLDRDPTAINQNVL